MSLTMSSASGGLITLPSPSLGNTDSINGRVEYKKSYDGTRYSYISTPAENKKVLVFANMSSTLANTLIGFLHLSASENVTIIWGVSTWVGRMLTKDFSDTTVNRRNGHTISVEFTTSI